MEAELPSSGRENNICWSGCAHATGSPVTSCSERVTFVTQMCCGGLVSTCSHGSLPLTTVKDRQTPHCLTEFQGRERGVKETLFFSEVLGFGSQVLFGLLLRAEPLNTGSPENVINVSSWEL